jgi:hypothetical protein
VHAPNPLATNLDNQETFPYSKGLLDVSSRHLMDWVEGKSNWLARPETEFAEVFVRREPFEGLAFASEVVGSEEVGQVRFELVVGVVEVSLDGGVLDGSVHAFYLPVGPRVVGLGEPVIDSLQAAEPVEGASTDACGRALPVLRQVGELDAVVGEHGVDALRSGFDERLEEGGSGPHICFFDDGGTTGDEQCVGDRSENCTKNSVLRRESVVGLPGE